MQEAPGKGMLKVTGILLIIFGGISVILSLFAFLGGGLIAAGYNELAGGLVALSGFVLLIAGALNLIVGILAVVNCGRPEKAQMLFVLAIVMIALQVVGIFTGGFDFSTIVALVLPVLLLVGATQNKNAYRR